MENDDEAIMPDEHCYLLALPKELRLHIYEELLTPRSIKLVSFDTPSIIGMPYDEVVASHFYFAAESGDTHTTLPAILRTCRHIYEEAKTLLYMPSRLILTPARGGSPSGDRKVLDPRLLQSHLKKLEELKLELVTVSSTAESDELHSAHLAKALLDGVEIQRASIAIDGPLSLPLYLNADTAEHECALETTTHMLGSWTALRHATELTVVLRAADNGEIVRVWERDAGGGWSVQESYDRPTDEAGHGLFDSELCDRYFAIVKRVLSGVDRKAQVD